MFFCLSPPPVPVHPYGTLLEADLSYAPLRPDQMDNGGLDMSMEEDTSSMDEIAQKCPMKPQKKTKGVAFLHTHSHNTRLRRLRRHCAKSFSCCCG